MRAYTAEDAHKFNRKLLELAEETVNRLNRRGRTDVVQLSEREVQDAQGAARRRLSRWLNSATPAASSTRRSRLPFSCR